MVVIAVALLCIFAAAVVRGYAGFGFALISITALSILLPPREIIPSIFVLELLASLRLLSSAWHDVHWQSLGRLCLGCLAGTPIGVFALARAPSAPLTVALAIVVLFLSVMLARGFALKALPGTIATVGTGAASGLLNGGLGIGGPPVVLFYFGSPAAIATGRASMIAYFLFTDVLALLWQWHAGLLSPMVFAHALLYVPPLLAGLWVGHKAFKRVDPLRFRRLILRLLMTLAVLSGGRALLQMF